MDPYVGIADKVIIRLAWITGRVSGRWIMGLSMHQSETGDAQWSHW